MSRTLDCHRLLRWHGLRWHDWIHVSNHRRLRLYYVELALLLAQRTRVRKDVNTAVLAAIAGDPKLIAKGCASCHCEARLEAHEGGPHIGKAHQAAAVAVPRIHVGSNIAKGDAWAPSRHTTHAHIAATIIDRRAPALLF